MSSSQSYFDNTSVNETATTTEQNFDFRAQHIFFISNDGDVTLSLNFDRATTDRGVIELEPGDVLNEMPLQVQNYVAVKTDTGTAAFRIIGLTD